VEEKTNEIPKLPEMLGRLPQKPPASAMRRTPKPPYGPHAIRRAIAVPGKRLLSMKISANNTGTKVPNLKAYGSHIQR